MPKTRVTIEQRLDGTTYFRSGEQYLKPVLLPAAPTNPELVKEAIHPVEKPKPLTRAGAAGKPIPANHPWKRTRSGSERPEQ